MSSGFQAFLALLVFVVMPAALLGVGVPLIVILAGAALLVCFLLLLVVIIPPYTGAIISFLGKPIRSVGPGAHLLFRPLESVAQVVLLQRRKISIKMNAETKDEEVVSLDISIEHQPETERLIRFLGFVPDQIESALVARIKSICSIEIRKLKDRDAVYDNLNQISKAIQGGFRTEKVVNGFTLEEHYGIHLISVMIDDPALPQKLVDAEVDREVQEKNNEKFGLEMKELKKQARLMVKEAERRGEKLSVEAAYKFLQVQRGIIKEDYRHYGISKDTLKTLESLLLALIGGASGKSKP